MENPQLFADLFQKYLKNRCSSEDTEYLMQLLQNEEYKAYANELIKNQVQRKSEIHADDFLLTSRLDERLKYILQTKVSPGPSRVIYFLHRWNWAVAASIVLVLSTGIYFHIFRKTHSENSISQVHFYITHPTNYTRCITLPDGSSVVLHAGSKLQYPETFTKNKREVTLLGEAYFDIAHDPLKPFIIQTGKIKTTVLGTAFNIKADSNHVVVSVTRGKVKVETESKVLAILTPDQQMQYNMPEAKIARQTVNAKNIISDWTKEDMIFNGISFKEITDILSKRYGVMLEFKNEDLKKCKIMASFSGTENLEQVLNVLCAIRNGSYEKLTNGTIMLNGKGCE